VARPSGIAIFGASFKHQSQASHASGNAMEQKTQRSNRRTGLILASVAAVFFFGVIIKHVFF
jgi:hypothetical protein